MLTLSLALAGLDRILSINLIFFFFTTFPLFCLLERVLLCPLIVSPFSALGGKDLSLSDWFSPGFEIHNHDLSEGGKNRQHMSEVFLGIVGSGM